MRASGANAGLPSLANWPDAKTRWPVRTARVSAADAGSIPSEVGPVRRRQRIAVQYNVAWFEEPLRPDAIEDYVALRRAARVPISGGEVLTRRQAFRPWLERGALDIVQPDATKVGGLSESRRIAWMADEFGVRFIPHGWNTAVGLAADLQLASALPHTDLVEYLQGSAFIDDVVSEEWRLDADGMLPIPDRPGLGLKLNLEAVAELSSGAASAG